MFWAESRERQGKFYGLAWFFLVSSYLSWVKPGAHTILNGMVRGQDTRAQLLNAAEQLVNEQGFAATSVEKVIDQVGVTKGSFFHHFKTKSDLGRALIDRYAERDKNMLRGCMNQAERLSDDPLQQVLLFVGLMIDVAETLDRERNPACLFATYCFESGLFDEATHETIKASFSSWTDAVAGKLRKSKVAHQLDEAELESLADMLTVLFEGAFVVARVRPGRGVFASQLRHYRNYLKLLLDHPS